MSHKNHQKLDFGGVRAMASEIGSSAEQFKRMAESIGNDSSKVISLFRGTSEYKKVYEIAQGMQPLREKAKKIADELEAVSNELFELAASFELA